MTEEEPWTSRDPWQVHVNENWSTRSSRESQSSYGDSWDQWWGHWSNWDRETEDVDRMSNCTPVYGQTSNYPYGQDWRGNWTPKSSRSASPARSGWNPNWFKSSRHDPWENYAWDDWYAPVKGLQLEQVQPSEVCPGNDSGVCHGDQKKGRGDDQPLSPTSRMPWSRISRTNHLVRFPVTFLPLLAPRCKCSGNRCDSSYWGSYRAVLGQMSSVWRMVALAFQKAEISVQTRCGIYCGREMALCPGVFGFFPGCPGKTSSSSGSPYGWRQADRGPWTPRRQDDIKGRLNSLFDFGEWQRPEQWTKFCGRYAVAWPLRPVSVGWLCRQTLVSTTTTSWSTASSSAPKRRSGSEQICGQLKWMAGQCHASKVLMKGLPLARLCRPDISFSVDRLASRITAWSRAEDVHLHRVHWTKEYQMVSGWLTQWYGTTCICRRRPSILCAHSTVDFWHDDHVDLGSWRWPILSFGVSGVQQLAGVDDPAALVELKLLVDRARIGTTVKYEHWGCELGKAGDGCASDASFPGMPRGRSQGGCVVSMATEILEGPWKIAVLLGRSGLLKRVVRSSLAAEIKLSFKRQRHGEASWPHRCPSMPT